MKQGGCLIIKRCREPDVHRSVVELWGEFKFRRARCRYRERVKSSGHSYVLLQVSRYSQVKNPIIRVELETWKQSCEIYGWLVNRLKAYIYIEGTYSPH